MTVLLVGSLAYDSVSSPAGSVDQALGGSATYGGLACQFHLHRLNGAQASIVGVVGTDFTDDDRALLSGAGLDLSGLETAEGHTFRWEGSYQGSMAEAETLATHLNVFEHFSPKVPSDLLEPSVLFCANLHPALQHSVMEQTSPTRLTMLDSMNLWISIARDPLMDVMEMADLVIINDGEARMLSGNDNLVEAMHHLAKITQTQTLVVKRGEHGVLALHGGAFIALPAYPTARLVDPTGCGDTFAGTLAAHLAQHEGPISTDELRQGLMMANVTASFTLESFGTEALRNLDTTAFDERFMVYRSMLGL